MEISSDQLNIDTPELVEIEMPLAGIGSRFIALLVDSTIWLAGFIALVILIALLPSGEKKPSNIPEPHISEQWAIAIVIFIIFLLFWGYFTLFEAFWNGQTPGKRVARIRVIQRSGQAIGLIESMTRNLVRYIDMQPLPLYAVGTIFIFATRQHQRLGDLAAGTLVVRDRALEEPGWGDARARTFTAHLFVPRAPAPEPHLAYTLLATGIAKLTSADLEVLVGFFARRLDMSLATRHALAERISAAIQAKSGLEKPDGASVETFLEAAARQLRDQARMQ
jgi:uncharacterized RDD family membrane protein YckC